MASTEPTDSVERVAADHIVFFDGVCVLCHGAVNQLIRLDRDGVLHFAQLQGETAAALGIAWDDAVPASAQSVAYVDTTGDEPQIHERSEAVRYALEAIGRWPALAALIRIVPTPLADLVYRGVAAVRYRVFGTYDECPLPPPDVRRRFLP